MRGTHPFNIPLGHLRAFPLHKLKAGNFDCPPIVPGLFYRKGRIAMIEDFETITVPLMSREFETDSADIKILIRYFTDDNIELQAEPVSYRKTGDQQMTILSNDTLSEFVRWLVRSEIDDAALRTIRDSNPAFESMGYADPPMSRDEYQRMVL